MRALRLATTALLLLGACGGDEPAPTERTTSPRPEAPSPPEAEPGPSYVDAFGNLRGSGDHVLGFEVPAGAERRADGPLGTVLYVPATRERLVRFYRSRGHQIIQTVSGWRIEHTERTLRERDGAEREASIRMDRGSGPGWTLRFDDGAPVDVAQPPLLKLIEEEQQVAGADEGGRAEPAEPGRVEAEEEDTGDDGPRHAPRAARRSGGGDDDASLSRLRERALDREVHSRRARDISDEIYEYAKAHPERRFLD
ncbi:MAG: hypothetical protein ACQEXJ_14935 [Myxococcota bacterium]